MSQQPGFGPSPNGQPGGPFGPSDPYRPGAQPAPVQPPGASWNPGSPPAPGSYPTARDPRQSFAAPPPTPVHIASFAPPKSPVSTIVTFAALAVLAGVIAAGMFLRSAPPPGPSPTATRATTGATSGRPGLPFTSQDGSTGGRWLIENSHWSTSGLSVHIRIFADDGEVSYSFQAFTNRGAQLIDPVPGADQPTLDTGSLEQGDQAEGWVYFPTQRDDITVVLRTADGEPLSAQVVKG